MHTCIDMELFVPGCKLCDALCYLEVLVGGDYGDIVGNSFGIKELFEHDLITRDFDTFLKEALYLTYVGNSLSVRAEELYSLFSHNISVF